MTPNPYESPAAVEEERRAFDWSNKSPPIAAAIAMWCLMPFAVRATIDAVANHGQSYLDAGLYIGSCGCMTAFGSAVAAWFALLKEPPCSS